MSKQATGQKMSKGARKRAAKKRKKEEAQKQQDLFVQKHLGVSAEETEETYEEFEGTDDVDDSTEEVLGEDEEVAPEEMAQPEEPEVELLTPECAWDNPEDIVYGTELSAEQLCAELTEGDAELDYGDQEGKKLDAGANQELTVTAPETATYQEVTWGVSINVLPAPSKLSWKEPKAVSLIYPPQTRGQARPKPYYNLSETELNATVAEGDAEPKDLIYSPAKGFQFQIPATKRLSVTHPATGNYEASTENVRFVVFDSLKAKEGYERVRDDSAWGYLPEDQLDDWNADEGGVKTQGEEIMKELTDKTAEELLDFMNKQVEDPAKDITTKGGNKLWKFKNGLQVRYKPNGDWVSSDPAFCIEFRTSEGFSNSPDDIAFKLTPDGQPAPKNPYETFVPNGLNNLQSTQYMNGACAASHLRCRPKLEQKITWAKPADIEYGTTLSITQLNATIDPEGNPLVYHPTFGFKPVGGALTLKVTAPKSTRYHAKVIQHTITVTKADPFTSWDVPTEIQQGTKVPRAIFKQGAPRPVYTPSIDKPLAVGDNKAIRVDVPGNGNYKPFTKTIRVSIKKK